jgi:DNA helicase-2/ATP-dependent DNA helicase PcrA
MDTKSILAGLNSPQQKAVTLEATHSLILAGAGSGKTRVLVHRIAWLIAVQNISPFSILAVTFTNKAANEMRERITRLLGQSYQAMWVGTFHGLAHRFLRLHYREAKLPENFTIIDSDDQLRLVKRVMRELNIDDERYPPKQAQWYINGKKDEGIRANALVQQRDIFETTMQKIYAGYENACRQANVIDFAELLLLSYEVLRDNAELLTHYQQRFQHILVDEFQDTNGIQYAWLKLIAGKNAYLMIVGDDDQSIYGWRGARVENIHLFSKDFPNNQIIRLEQNYRSTATILSAANAMIDNNVERLGKTLWTEGDKGEPIGLYASFNELEEARFIVDKIQQWYDAYGEYKNCAILYRSNAQSRVLEDALISANVPYRVYGGQRFFDRAEIKDALAYLRLINQRDDNVAFERVVNTPARGIGERSLDVLREHAKANEISLWQAAEQFAQQDFLAARIRGSLQGFVKLINEFSATADNVPLHELVEHVTSRSGLMAMFQQEKGERGQSKVENLQELVTATRQYAENNSGGDEPIDSHRLMLQSFLAHAVLEAGETQAEVFADSVQLMTLHSSKGLEFPLVFLAGMEEGLFPHSRSSKGGDELEEERRLCYVGMTRAMKKLILSYAETRRFQGQERYARPSRFIAEIPEELIQEIRPRERVSSSITSSGNSFNRSRDTNKGFYNRTYHAVDLNEGEYRLGQRVRHAKFGEGVVVACEGSGKTARVQIRFDQVGTKWLIVGFANLETMA